MLFVMSFWLPILCATAAIFVASWVVWMLLPHHKSDWKKLDNEEAVIAAIRQGIAGPGQYQFPWAKEKEAMKDPDFLKKCDEGPVGSLVVWKGNPMKIGKSLLLHFVHTLVLVSLVTFACYRILGFGTQYLSVLKMAGFFAFLGYVGALPTQAIWFGRPWSVIFKEIADGIFYALLMGSILGLLWPFRG